MDPTPSTYSISCAQILGPETKLITVLEGNVFETDSSQVKSFTIIVIWGTEVTLALLYTI